MQCFIFTSDKFCCVLYFSCNKALLFDLPSYTYLYQGEEGNISFNDALNILYSLLYGILYLVKNHSDSERGNLLPSLHGLLFPISSKEYFYAVSHEQDSTYHGLLYPICGALVGTKNNCVGPPSGIFLTTRSAMSGCCMTELHLEM